VKRRILTILVCAAILAILSWLSRSAEFVEGVYARRISAQIVHVVSIITGVVPFSLAELALAGVAAYFLVPLVVTAIRVRRRERTFANALIGGLLRVVTAALFIVTFFYVSWGLNYARAPLAARLQWPPIVAATDPAAQQRQVDEIATLTEQLVDVTNAAYREAMGGDDFGRPSDRSASAPSLDVVFDAAYLKVQQRLVLEPPFAISRGRAKPLIASEVMNRLGLAGFFFPWTGEANYNRLQPGPALPESVAHEKAHQRGIAPEDEAGFLGYLACVMSDDAYARYSGALFAQRQLLGELGQYDLNRARALLARRLPGVQRDVDFIRAFWTKYEGTATRVSQTVNDRYLKSQGVKAGIGAYAASRNLIVLYARQNGGKAF